MAEDIQLRFRHTAGDLGPYTFQETATIQEIKEKLVAEWPKEGAFAKEAPVTSADVKLILGGKYVDNAKTLKEYTKDMGEIKPDTVVTFHAVIRLTNAPKQTGASQAEKEPPKGCGCILS